MGMTTAERSARHRAKDVEAYREKKSEYARTEQQREYRRNYMKGWRERNREKHNKYANDRYHRDRVVILERSKGYWLKMKYGMTVDDKNRMFAEQSGLCLICAKDLPDGRGTHVDHCHKTGRVRGLLCHPCNTRLGWFENNREAVEGYLA